MTRATRGRSLKVPGATGTTRQAGRRPGLPARAGGDQLTVTGRNEPAGGCLFARPLRLIIPSSRCGGPASPEPVLLDRQMIDGLLGATRDGVSGTLGPASPGPSHDRSTGRRRGSRGECAVRLLPPSIPSWISLRAARRIRRSPGSCALARAPSAAIFGRYSEGSASLREPGWSACCAAPRDYEFPGFDPLPGQCAADCGSRRPGTTSPTPWS
jgi:hypothetical protein